MTRKAEWQYGRAPSNSWGFSFQHIFYLSAKWRRSFPRPACRTRLREGFQLQSLSYSRSMLALIPILLPFEVTPTAGGRLQSTSWQKGDQVLARDLPWPSPHIRPQGRCKGPPPKQWHILTGLTFYIREAVGLEEMTFVCLHSKSFHHPWFISLTFIFTKAPWEISGTGEMWSWPEGKVCVKEEEGELSALASH